MISLLNYFTHSSDFLKFIKNGGKKKLSHEICKTNHSLEKAA